MIRWVLGIAAIMALAALACAGGGEVVKQQPQQPAPAAQPQAAAPAPEPLAALAPAVAARSAAPAAPAPSTPQYGGSIIFSARGDPRGGFDPHLPGGRRETRQPIGLAYEMVGVWDTVPGEPCSVAIRPWLAESWRFVDGTTVEIKLRQGIKFQNKPPVNGREMVAEDVKYSYERLFLQGLQTTLGKNILSIDAPDKYTLRIKTRQPVPLIADELLSWREAPVLAKEAGGAAGKFDTKESFVGTGPFLHTEYTPGVGHVFKRNSDYWVKGRPYLDEVRVPIMRDESTKVAALQVGKLDFLEELSVAERARLTSRAIALRFIPCETGSPYALYLRNDITPFNDIRVRRAFSMAVDREAVLKGMLQGEGNQIGIAPFFVEGALKPDEFPAEVRKYLQYTPQEAKRLLAQAGYPNGLDLEVFVSFHLGTPFNEQAEAFPAMVRSGGFNVTLRVGDPVTYQDAANYGRYGVAGLLKGGGSFPIEVLVGSFYSKNDPARNRPALKDAEYDRLVEKLTTSFDPKERAELVKLMQVRLVDQANWISMPTFFNYHGISSRLQGELKVNEQTFRYHAGLMFRDIWVQR
jgi:peptide/nickel transport system substrate-binding protein